MSGETTESMNDLFSGAPESKPTEVQRMAFRPADEIQNGKTLSCSSIITQLTNSKTLVVYLFDKNIINCF